MSCPFQSLCPAASSAPLRREALKQPFTWMCSPTPPGRSGRTGAHRCVSVVPPSTPAPAIKPFGLFADKCKWVFQVMPEEERGFLISVAEELCGCPSACGRHLQSRRRVVVSSLAVLSGLGLSAQGRGRVLACLLLAVGVRTVRCPLPIGWPGGNALAQPWAELRTCPAGCGQLRGGPGAHREGVLVRPKDRVSCS